MVPEMEREGTCLRLLREREREMTEWDLELHCPWSKPNTSSILLQGGGGAGSSLQHLNAAGGKEAGRA